MKRNGLSSPTLALLIIGVFLLTAAAVVATQAGGPTRTNSTTTTASNSASVSSIQGLRLDVGLSTTVLQPGQTLQVSVSEYNSLGTANNVSASKQWPVQVALGACPNLDMQPFGIAVYSGHVGAQNLSQATQLRIFPLAPCPLLMRLVTGYYFQPSSASATVLPSAGGSPSPMSANVNVSAIYTEQAKPLPQGAYTLVAADEWGAVAFLYFTVA